MRAVISAAALALALALPAAASATEWVIDQDASSVGFETTVFGETVGTRFTEFSAEIVLDPDNLETASIQARVQTASAGALGESEYDEAMNGRAGLNPSAHPEAIFMSETVTRTDAGYEARGTLTLKDVSREIVLPFTLEIEDGRARAEGSFTVETADFNMGGSSWSGAAETVTITLSLEADRAG